MSSIFAGVPEMVPFPVTAPVPAPAPPTPVTTKLDEEDALRLEKAQQAIRIADLEYRLVQRDVGAKYGVGPRDVVHLDNRTIVRG